MLLVCKREGLNGNGDTEVGVERLIQTPDTLLALQCICCFKTPLILVRTKRKPIKKNKPINCVAARVICLGLSVKTLSLPGKDKLTFFLCNLMECHSLTSDNSGKAHYNSLARHERDQQHMHLGLFGFTVV